MENMYINGQVIFGGMNQYSVETIFRLLLSLLILQETDCGALINFMTRIT